MHTLLHARMGAADENPYGALADLKVCRSIGCGDLGIPVVEGQVRRFGKQALLTLKNCLHLFSFQSTAHIMLHGAKSYKDAE